MGQVTAILAQLRSSSVGSWLARHAGLLAVLAWAAWFLSPLLASGYYGDDELNACVRGYLLVRGQNLWQFTAHYIGFHFRQGRFFPGALAITYGVHYLFPATLSYKYLQLGLVLGNFAAFYGLLRCWRVPPAAAQLGTIGLVLLVQMRLAADPVLSYAGLLGFVTAECLGSLICFQKFLDSSRRTWLAASVALYVLSLITYEISFALLPVYLVMAWWHCGDWRSTLRVARAHGMTFAVALLLTIVLRQCHRPTSATYRLHVAPVPVALTTLRQASCALPLSYALLSPHRSQVLDARRALTQPQNWAVAGAWGALSLALLVAVRRRQTGPATNDVPAAPDPPLGLLAVCGTLLWLLPGLAIAVSHTYQELVHFGLGYLPVYLQYFGAALVGLAGWLWVIERWGRWAGAALVGPGLLVALVTFDVNRHVVETFEATPTAHERRLLEAALDAGLADGVPQGATILTNRFHSFLGDGPPESSGFFSTHLGRTVHAVSGRNFPNQRTVEAQLAGIPAPTFILNDECIGDGGYVVLSPSHEGPGDGGTATAAGDVRIFLHGTLSHAPPAGTTADGDGWTLQRLGPDWAIYAGHLAQPVEVARLIQLPPTMR